MVVTLFVHMVDVVISSSVDVTSGTAAPETCSVSSRAVVTVSAVRKRSESSFRSVVLRDSCMPHVSVLFGGRLVENSNGDVAATLLVGPWELMAVAVWPLVESPSELVFADFEAIISVTE